MLDVKEQMKTEERSAGRPCRLVNCHITMAGEDEIMLLVFDPEPTELDGQFYSDRRWAVITQDGDGVIHRTGGIVSQWVT